MPVSINLSSLEEASHGSLPKLRHVVQEIRAKFPNISIPSILERVPEKDLFKATKLEETSLNTSIVDEYMDYGSRRVLGRIKTSDYGKGYKGISYSHNPSPNVEEELSHCINPDGTNFTIVKRTTYTPNKQHIIEERKFSSETAQERVRTFDPQNGKELSNEIINMGSPKTFANVRTQIQRNGKIVKTIQQQRAGKKLVTTVEKDSNSKCTSVSQLLDGKQFANVQRNSENGDIVMNLSLLDSKGMPTGESIKYTFTEYGIGKEVEIYSKDNVLQARQSYSKSGEKLDGGFNNTRHVIHKPSYNLKGQYINGTGNLNIDFHILSFLR